MPFFDAPTRFPDGARPARAADRGADLVAFAVAPPDRPLRGADRAVAAGRERSGDPKADVLALTQAMARRLEYHIASHPEQWTVFQKRWPRAHGPGEE